MNKTDIFINLPKLQKLHDHNFHDEQNILSNTVLHQVAHTDESVSSIQEGSLKSLITIHPLFSFIVKHLGEQGIQMLLNISNVKEYYKREIVKREDLSDHFAIIMSGKVGVFYPVQRKKEYYLLIDSKLKGDNLTDWELDKNNEQNLFYRCQSNVYLLFINKLRFSLIRKNVDSKKMQKMTNFLALNSMFKNLNISITPFLEKTYSLLEIKEMNRNECVYREGDTTDGLYFVYRGNLKVVQ